MSNHDDLGAYLMIIGLYVFFSFLVWVIVASIWYAIAFNIEFGDIPFGSLTSMMTTGLFLRVVSVTWWFALIVGVPITWLFLAWRIGSTS